MSTPKLPSATSRRHKTLLLFLERGPLTVEQAMPHCAAWFNFCTKAIFRKELTDMVERRCLAFDEQTAVYALPEPVHEALLLAGHEAKPTGEKVLPAYHPAFQPLQMKN